MTADGLQLSSRHYVHNLRNNFCSAHAFYVETRANRTGFYLIDSFGNGPCITQVTYDAYK